VTKQNQVRLHLPACFDGARLVVVALRRRTVVVTKEARRDADMKRVINRNAGGSAIAKQMWIDRSPERRARALDASF